MKRKLIVLSDLRSATSTWTAIDLPPVTQRMAVQAAAVASRENLQRVSELALRAPPA
jgi:hypothetical protein